MDEVLTLALESPLVALPSETTDLIGSIPATEIGGNLPAPQ
jgi:hypothetical protein